MYAITKKICWGFLLIVCLIPQNILAASGIPNSNTFGYGVRVDLQGIDPYKAIQEAGKFNLDWIAIDFNWQHLQPEAASPPAWKELDIAMRLAAENQLAVMISITHLTSCP